MGNYLRQSWVGKTFFVSVWLCKFGLSPLFSFLFLPTPTLHSFLYFPFFLFSLFYFSGHVDDATIFHEVKEGLIMKSWLVTFWLCWLTKSKGENWRGDNTDSNVSYLGNSGLILVTICYYRKYSLSTAKTKTATHHKGEKKKPTK